MLRAAFTSRSCTAPQVHVHSRTFSGSFAATVPQLPHSFELGKKLSITTSSRPYQTHSYSSIMRSPDHEASEMARASAPFFNRLRTVRSSITTTWFSWTMREVSLCRKSRRRSAIRAWTLATRRRAFSRFAEPFALRDNSRCALARRARSRRSCRGLAIFSPVDRVTREVIPASRPTAACVAGAGAMASSTSIDTNQRPAASRDTVTVVGSTPSGSRRDQRTSKDSAILARVSRPSRQVKALRVYSAEARDSLRDLKRGYCARLAKKWANAVCRWRSACWSGTEDTSVRKASSSVFFHWVSAAEDCT